MCLCECVCACAFLCVVCVCVCVCVCVSLSLSLSLTHTHTHTHTFLPQVLDEAVLPNYPYRDDGILVYNVIKDYVTNVLNIYYGGNFLFLTVIIWFE